MISISGITKRQKRMLNIMWNLDSQEDYFEWYNSLDSELQNEADLLQRLVILESYEEDLGDCIDAKKVLGKFAKLT
jgi:predicted translin family RNA/ssDNA-binding protein